MRSYDEESDVEGQDYAERTREEYDHRCEVTNAADGLAVGRVVGRVERRDLLHYQRADHDHQRCEPRVARVVEEGLVAVLAQFVARVGLGESLVDVVRHHIHPAEGR